MSVYFNPKPPPPNMDTSALASTLGAPSVDAKSSHVLFRPLDWTVVEEQGDEDDETHIHIWASDDKDKPCLLRVYNFGVRCWLQLPEYVNNKPYVWTKAKADIVIDYISKRMGGNKPTSAVFCLRRTLYYYPGQGHPGYPMIALIFRNNDSMRHCTNLIKRPLDTYCGSLQCVLHETDIPLVRKLLTERKLGYNEWARATAYPVSEDDRISIDTVRELYIDYHSLEKATSEMGVDPDRIPNYKILSMDIECYSHQHKAMPNKLNAQDVAYIITAVTQRRTDDSKQRKRYGIIMGDCNNIPAERMANVTILRVKTEYELVDAYCKLVRDEDPDIIIGYNIMGFDYEYLDARIARRLQKWPAMSRLRNSEVKLNSKTWESAAYGTNIISNLIIWGRITFDLLHIVKRDYKLKDYTLETVCQHFLGRGKYPIKAEAMFLIYEEMEKALSGTDVAAIEEAKRKMTEVVYYGLIDSDLPLDLVEKLNVIPAICESANIFGVTNTDLFMRGQQIRVLSQLYNTAFWNGVVVTTNAATRDSFSGGAVRNPITGFHRNIICLDFSSLYPSIMRAYNICYTTLVRPEDFDRVPDHLCNIVEFEQEEKNGKALDAEGDAEGTDDLDKDDREEKTRDPNAVRMVKYRFKFLKEPKGLLSQLEEHLVGSRSAVRKLQKKHPEGSLLYTILDKRQLAYKTSANSVFGFTGVKNGKRPLMELAMSITGYGRLLVGAAWDFVSKRYADRNPRIIYGDTDSVMIDLNIKERKEVYIMGKKLEEEISGNVEKGIKGIFPPPLGMEFEKGMDLLCFKRKNYAAVLINKDGSLKTDEKDILRKGLPTERRDKAPVLVEMYKTGLRNILLGRPLTESLLAVVETIEAMLKGALPVEKYAIYCKMGDNYKSKTYPLRLFGDYLRANGFDVKPGDRLAHIFVKHPEEEKRKVYAGEKMRLVEQMKDPDNKEVIDVNYYIEKRFSKPINLLLSVGYKADLPKLSGITFKSARSRKVITMETPMTLILKMMHDNIPVRRLYEAVVNILQPKAIDKPRLVIKTNDVEQAKTANKPRLVIAK